MLIAWGAAIILSPISLDPVAAALKRCFFPLTVLAPILLSSALTGVAPVSRTQKKRNREIEQEIPQLPLVLIIIERQHHVCVLRPCSAA